MYGKLGVIVIFMIAWLTETIKRKRRLGTSAVGMLYLMQG